MQMFVFGILALEQFVDRLIEWPQYCNHILQISHLRVANPELVVFIERALARISLAHSESEVGHSPAVDQFHGPIPSSPMNSEVSYYSGLISIRFERDLRKKHFAEWIRFSALFCKCCFRE